jgi:hypothetical protein
VKCLHHRGDVSMFWMEMRTECGYVVAFLASISFLWKYYEDVGLDGEAFD